MRNFRWLSAATRWIGDLGIGGGLAAFVLAAWLVPTGAAAQDDSRGLPKLLTLPSIPSATVAPNGTLFASLSGTTRREGTGDDPDGSLALGAGFGSAEDTLGLQATAEVTSLTDDFADSGYFALKASRRLLAGAAPTYAALEVNHLGNWGDANGVDPQVTFGVTTFAQISLGSQTEKYPVMFTLGAGSDIDNNQTDPGVYAGAGIGLTPYFGMGAAWVGEYADVGVAFLIPGLKNIGFTASVNDVFDQQDSQRLSLSVNWVMSNVFGGFGG